MTLPPKNRDAPQAPRQLPLPRSGFVQGPYWYIRDRSTDELYDMRKDRSQRWNLAPEVADLDAYRRLAARRPQRRGVPNPVESDEELVEQLRSLGCAE